MDAARISEIAILLQEARYRSIGTERYMAELRGFAMEAGVTDAEAFLFFMAVAQRMIQSKGGSEFEERARLIEGMLDQIYPFHPNMPEHVREGVEQDRQTVVLRAGWGGMPIEELRRIAST